MSHSQTHSGTAESRYHQPKTRCQPHNRCHWPSSHSLHSGRHSAQRSTRSHRHTGSPRCRDPHIQLGWRKRRGTGSWPGRVGRRAHSGCWQGRGSLWVNEETGGRQCWHLGQDERGQTNKYRQKETKREQETQRDWGGRCREAQSEARGRE